MIPYTLSALLINDPEKIKMISSTSDLIMQEPYAFGQVTLLHQCLSFLECQV